MKTLFTIMVSMLLVMHAYAQDNKAKGSVRFEISNMMVNTVEGHFDAPEGTVIFTPDNLANARFDVYIDAESILTDNEKRDEHFRKEDFFNVSAYPKICFTSQEVMIKNNGYAVRGALQLKGIVKEIEIPFQTNDGILQGSFMVEREAFNLGSEYGSFMIGDEVEITLAYPLN